MSQHLHLISTFNIQHSASPHDSAHFLPGIQHVLQVPRAAGFRVDSGHRLGTGEAEEQPGGVVDDQLHAVGLVDLPAR